MERVAHPGCVEERTKAWRVDSSRVQTGERRVIDPPSPDAERAAQNRMLGTSADGYRTAHLARHPPSVSTSVTADISRWYGERPEERRATRRQAPKPRAASIRAVEIR